MSNIPLVSVIIPAYRHRDHVLCSIQSVLDQTFRDYEIIVVNDGSPDDTRAVLAPLANAGAIRYLEQANCGQSAARNRGLREARGQFVAFLDDDDWWPVEKLAWQLGEFETSPATVLVYGYATAVEAIASPATNLRSQKLVPKGPQCPSGLVREAFLRRNYIQSPGQTLIRRQAVVTLGGFDEALAGADDYDLYIRLAQLGMFQYRNQPALFYRFHVQNASRNVEHMFRVNCLTRKKHLGRFPTPRNASLWLANYQYCNGGYNREFLRAAWHQIVRGDRQAARRLLLRALQIYPFGLFKRNFWSFYLRSFFAGLAPKRDRNINPRAVS